MSQLKVADFNPEWENKERLINFKTIKIAITVPIMMVTYNWICGMIYNFFIQMRSY